MTEYSILKSPHQRVLEIWHSPAASISTTKSKSDLPHVTWKKTETAQDMQKAMSAGQVRVAVLTLDDILGTGFESIPAQARSMAVWLLVVVPEPHPFFEMVADRRLLVRAEALPQVIQGLMRNMIGTD